MKKKNIFLSLLMITSLSSCSIPVIGQFLCSHEYVEIERLDGTCQRVGSVTNECSKCGLIKTTMIPKGDHVYNVNVLSEASCTKQGHAIYTCKYCGDSFEDIVDYTHEFKEERVDATNTSNGYITKTCSKCGYSETTIINCRNYIDVDVINYDYKNASIRFETLDDLKLYYSSSLLRMVDSFNCDVTFKYESLEWLLNELEEFNKVPFSHMVGVKQSIAGFNFKFTYSEENKISADDSNKYIQLNSANYKEHEVERSTMFDDFAINHSELSYEVRKSDQLFYVLERACKPICEAGSEAETYYNKLKDILRKIITNDMNDYQKALAIHDYLVMNITYDKTLYNKFFEEDSQSMSKYKGFYIDGVLDDNRAVCEGIAKAFTCLANIEGIPCVMVEAKKTGVENGVGHTYNKILIDNKWYIADATSDGCIINDEKEVLTYDYFLIDEATMVHDYTGTTFTNIECNDNYNVFEIMYYDDDKDFNITSEEELIEALRYFSTFKSNTSIELYLNYKYSGSPMGTVQNASKKALLLESNSYKYLTNANSGKIVIIK